VGLKAHDRITQNEQVFKRWVGGGLVVVSVFGLWNLYEANNGRKVSFSPSAAPQVSHHVSFTSFLLPATQFKAVTTG
jgi:D-Tyr-tRNAtyr deacylase